MPTSSNVAFDRSPLGAAAARLLAIAAWFALLLQLWLTLGLAQAKGRTLIGGMITYCGYFTILTNLFVALVCTAGSLRRPAADRPFLYRLPAVGCSTAAILAVGIGYHTLLREIWAPQGGEWLANLMLHYIVPVGGLLHWLLYSYTEKPTWRAPLSWCWYPLAYFAYVMTRGEFLFSYPYPFIDVLTLGYTQTVVNALGFLVWFTALGYVLLWFKRLERMVREAQMGPV